ncbi:MAG: flagellar assembly protein FliW [Chthonomonadales bacterium]
MAQATRRRTLHVNTTRFGPVEVSEKAVITFPNGLIGFEQFHRFVLLEAQETSPIQWLQSVEDGSLAFPVINPWDVRPDYTPLISAGDTQALDLEEDTPRAVLAIVTIPRQDPRQITVNLLGPILINMHTRTARQIVVENAEYTTRHRIADAPAEALAQQAA